MQNQENLKQESLPLVSKLTGDSILKTTPMFQQFLEIKAENEGCLLFFRMGDFYELFFEDAVIAAKELDIALTSRGKYDGKPVPMCGVPYHSYMPYLEKLTKNNFKIAICEQVESPEEAKLRGGNKAIVKREVVRVVTPGTLTEEVLLDAEKNNFLLSIYKEKENIGFSWLDISTGELFTQIGNKKDLCPSIARIRPSEILIIDNSEIQALKESIEKAFNLPISSILQNVVNGKKAEKLICIHYGIKSLSSFGSFTSNELIACWSLLEYVSMTQKGYFPPIGFPSSIKSNTSMMIDVSTRKSLEISENLAGNKKGSLISAVNKTLTSVGARKLYEDISAPLTDIKKINSRLDMVSFFIESNHSRQETREILKLSADIDRAKARIVLSRGGPRDLKSILFGIEAAHRLEIIYSNKSIKKLPTNFKELKVFLKGCTKLLKTLNDSVVENPPLFIRDGGFIKKGYSVELDKIKSLRDKSRTHILNLELSERKKTNLPALKIKYNNAIGYFFEVTQLQKEKLLKSQNSERFIPRQSLKGAARFMTDELSELSESITSSVNKAIELEINIYEELKNMINLNSKELSEISYAIACLDVSSSLAEVSIINNFIRPTITNGKNLEIKGGRHPSVELSMKKSGEGQFYSNDCDLRESDRIWLITGPNMAGKSTFLRQNALISILAQAGCYVPADSAVIGIIDSLFSRVGSSDDLASGRSTFMVEMLETAAILNQATEKSLVIMDEVGRGTSTYDGLSIAWAILEHLHSKTKSRTLFATHYHELIQLSLEMPALSCHTMKVKEWDNKIIFLYTVIDGIAKGSYGIHVASLAGVPHDVIDRAKQILSNFEDTKKYNQGSKNIKDLKKIKNNKENKITAKDKLLDEVASINLDQLTPKDALDKLYSYVNKIKKIKE